ncbi:MAG: hypothetical protein GY863_05355 [bacterium]|nr:hypothetical protein [bacterium]
MTKRLYRENPYRTEFDSKIIEKLDIDGRNGVVLNETLFYPTSGGQLHDTGLINDVRVTDVIERENSIVHFVEKSIGGSAAVIGKIDWDRRFDHMQQHTGQHILSQSLIRLFDAGTLSSYLGNDFSTIDLDKDNFTSEEAKMAENEANMWIYRNVPVNILYPDDDEIKKMPLRKMPPPGKKTRIVNIEGLDFSPCGGTHCAKTGEVGMVKILRWGKMRGNVRLDFYCGKRALIDYRIKNDLINTIKGNFSVSEDDIIKKLSRLEEENKTLRKTLGELNLKLIDSQAEELFNNAQIINNTKLITSIFDELNIRDLQNLARKISECGDSVIVLGSTGEKPSFVFYRSEKIDLDLQTILNNLKDKYSIKGGGSSSMVQGGLPDNSDLKSFINAASESVNNSCNNL